MPGCARSPKLNGLDWVLQLVLADIPLQRGELAEMAAGGLLMEIAVASDAACACDQPRYQR
jgi:molybdenum cofactor cytidylyltransferase